MKKPPQIIWSITQIDKGNNNGNSNSNNNGNSNSNSNNGNGGNKGNKGNSNLPKTGGTPAVAVGLFGTIIATIGSVMFKKKK